MTKKEALELGYTLCGKPHKEWQSLHTIEDLTEDDFEDGDFVLATKEYEVPTIDRETIAEILAGHIQENHSWDTGDDTEEVYNTVNSLDFSFCANMINEALEKHKHYGLTDIPLTK